ncbi:hypothetical protein Tcan_09306 [Toxocara canis]|uniref:Galaxin-like repeats domain-containing protein n=1 Tax=Toxocara canis TaxID=6265 RepID=A0A0B2VBP4_TOXCA|nr:hypothetical protein Tcan_09306 [Toxocara canis]
MGLSRTCIVEVHDVANADCCGSQPFDRNDKSTLCCDGVLTHGNPPGSTCCGREPYDGGLSEICCGGRVFRKCRFDSCCLSNNGTFIAFASTTHSCCDEPIARRAMDEILCAVISAEMTTTGDNVIT